MRVNFFLSALFLSACHLSHEVGDSSSRDGSVLDANTGTGTDADVFGDSTSFRDGSMVFRDGSTVFRDGAMADGAAGDVPSRDAAPLRDGFGGDASDGVYIRATTCESRFPGVGRGILEWPSVDCGHVSNVQVEALSDGRILAVATEARECDDRPGRVLAQYVTSPYRSRYVGGNVILLGTAHGTAYSAANGDEVAVCSGDEIYILGSDREITQTRRPPPAGCSSAGPCVGITPDGDGWALIADAPDCAGAHAQLERIDANGEAREEPWPTMTAMHGIASAPWGVVAIGAPSAGSAVFYSWNTSASTPEVHIESGLRPTAQLGAISPWPYEDGAWLMVFADDVGMALRAIDRRGDVLLERYRTRYRQAPLALSAQATTFGVTIGVSYDPASEVGSEYVEFFFDERGDYFRDPENHLTNGQSGTVHWDQSWGDSTHVVHLLPQFGAYDRTLILGIQCGDDV